MFTKTFRLIYIRNETPDQWGSAKTQLMFKNKGDKKDIENYCPIANFCNASNFFLKN
jgi:hypothetical protein